MNLVLYAISLFGLCYIVGYSQISLPIRRALRYLASAKEGQPERHTIGFFLDMIECPACLSFHLGWIVDLLVPGVLNVVTDGRLVAEPRVFHAFLAAILASGCSAILGHLTGVMKS